MFDWLLEASDAVDKYAVRAYICDHLLAGMNAHVENDYECIPGRVAAHHPDVHSEQRLNQVSSRDFKHGMIN